MSCKHLEISEFSTYSVDMGGRAQVMTLQKCSNCGKYLTLDGREVSDERILGRESAIKPKMRTVTMHLNSELYEELKTILEKEVADKDYSTKVMNEIVALGMKQYRRHLRHN